AFAAPLAWLSCGRLPPPGRPPSPYTTLFRSRTAVVTGDAMTGPRKAGLAASVVLGALLLTGCADKTDIITWTDEHGRACTGVVRSEEHTSELQSREKLVCRPRLGNKSRERVP